MIHLLGFGGSALIILSITMHSVVRLRLIGLAGAGTFVVYGLVLGAWPVVVTNIVTSSIHLYHVRRLAQAGSLRPTTTAPVSPAGVGKRRESA